MDDETKLTIKQNSHFEIDLDINDEDGRVCIIVSNGKIGIISYRHLNDFKCNSIWGVIAESLQWHDDITPFVKDANNPKRIAKREKSNKDWQEIVKWMNKPSSK